MAWVGHRYLHFTCEVFHGIAVGGSFQVGNIALIDYFTAQSSGFRTDVDDVVGGADYLLVVFNDYNRIADLL